MQLNKFSDYSLRVLIYLATMDSEKTTAQSIAQAYDISYHHIAKACQWLARQGYVSAERGRQGGISLALSPSEINIGDVVAKLESETALVECLKPSGGGCCIAPACGLRMAIAEAEAAFMNTLKQFTLSNIVSQKSALQTLLANSGAAA